MNENLPYDDELKRRLNDLPLPDEDIAWEDMKRRLEKDDDDKPIVLPVLKSCGGCGLLLLLLTIAGLFIVNPVKWFNDDKTKNTITKTGRTENRGEGTKDTISNKLPPLNNANYKTIGNDDTILNPPGIMHSIPGNDTLIEKKEVLKTGSSHINPNKMQGKDTGTNKQNIKKNNPFKEQNDAVAIKNNRKYMPGIKKRNVEIKRNGSANTKADSAVTDSKNINVTEEEKQRYAADTIGNAIRKGIQKPGVDVGETSDTVANRKGKSASVKQKNIYFSAGLGVHQLLPVAGQKSNPYNSLGRKSSLGDYIPSVYVRMYQDKKWFVQSELRYGAPQYTKEVLFYEKKIIDSFGQSATSSGSRLKKTFYHQLPVSFNYFVLPGFSMGAGVTFNKFSSALVQQEVHRSIIATQTDTLVSSVLVSQKKADSNFVTSYLQALVEAQYRWKRFSAGARYSFGLQPYLKFKLPGGEQRNERNSSLQLFIRYEFWQSAKKNKK